MFLPKLLRSLNPSAATTLAPEDEEEEDEEVVVEVGEEEEDLEEVETKSVMEVGLVEGGGEGAESAEGVPSIPVQAAAASGVKDKAAVPKWARKKAGRANSLPKSVPARLVGKRSFLQKKCSLVITSL